jgi:hypothetical protein
MAPASPDPPVPPALLIPPLPLCIDGALLPPLPDINMEGSFMFDAGAGIVPPVPAGNIAPVPPLPGDMSVDPDP